MAIPLNAKLLVLQPVSTKYCELDITNTAPSNRNLLFNTPMDHAFSLRKLNPNYSGNCIRVRRASDNAQQDIGFSNDVLDESALTSFVGSGYGYVRTWYNQFNADHNLEQEVYSSQPKICYSNGVVVKENGKPAIWSDGTANVYMYCNSMTGLQYFTPVLISVVGKMSATEDTYYGLVYLSGGDAYSEIFIGSLYDSETAQNRLCYRTVGKPSVYYPIGFYNNYFGGLSGTAQIIGCYSGALFYYNGEIAACHASMAVNSYSPALDLLATTTMAADLIILAGPPDANDEYRSITGTIQELLIYKPQYWYHTEGQFPYYVPNFNNYINIFYQIY